MGLAEAKEALMIEQIADAVVARLASKDGLHRRILTITEAAEYLGLTEHAIRHKVAREEIPVTRIDRHLRFDRVKLDAWIDQNTSLGE